MFCFFKTQRENFAFFKNATRTHRAFQDPTGTHCVFQKQSEHFPFSKCNMNALGFSKGAT